MTNFIILLILALALFFGVRSSIKHFKGQGGCCGGGSYKPRRKKLNTVIGRKMLTISGMTCEHCQNRVTEALNDLEGVSASVSFRKGTAVVSFSQPVEDAVLKNAVEKSGYEVTSIR